MEIITGIAKIDLLEIKSINLTSSIKNFCLEKNKNKKLKCFNISYFVYVLILFLRKSVNLSLHNFLS